MVLPQAFPKTLRRALTVLLGTALPAGAALSAEDAVNLALAANPQVQAAKAQYEAALRQVLPAYAPQEPLLSFTASQSQHGLFHPYTESAAVSEAFQFPGKAWLQGGQARRAAELARLAYMAAARDARAQAQTVYYQALLDGGLAETSSENAGNLQRVLKVAEVAYSANHVDQSDLISAEFDSVQASQTTRQSRVAELNDEAALNQVMARDPATPLELSPGLPLKPLQLPLAELLARGRAARQELLEAALTETNARTALRLARMELLPDLSLSYARNSYMVDSVRPADASNSAALATHDNTASIGLSVPVFFWFRQREDAHAASALLEAARASRRSVELQTDTAITQLYRSTVLAYDSAVLYRDSLIPLARQDFQVALVAYTNRKVDFQALAGTLQRIYNARIGYLTAANQFLAGRVALEQAVGTPLPL